MKTTGLGPPFPFSFLCIRCHCSFDVAMLFPSQRGWLGDTGADFADGGGSVDDE